METFLVWCGAISFFAAAVWSLEVSQGIKNRLISAARAIAIILVVPLILLLPAAAGWPWWAYPLFWILAPVGLVILGAFIVADLQTRFGRR
ncbi:hypothetical protein [Gordonia sp. OPL2]|uniref:hypothetical protein n=1 Tax=Gordonia sp. OPL2 TaxID=2486274 RepID=UPI00165522F0|nr:hypothetical protein [Gordonia sp. OPL2]RPA19880.1 hypothetical protein EEB19_02215 [Gordonia sp. OPL2]